MTTRRSLRQLAFLAYLTIGLFAWATFQAVGQGQSTTETTAGWAKSPKSPVLGGDLGTCFDVSLLKDGDTYLMWLS